MKKTNLISLFLPIIFSLYSCSPVVSFTTPSPTVSASVTPTDQNNLTTNTTIDLSTSLKTKADFVKAYQCVIDNPSVNDNNKAMAKSNLAVINALPEFAFTALTTTAYIDFLKNYDISKCSQNPVISTQPVASNLNYSSYTCSNEVNFKSGIGKSINVNFTNNSGKSINIYWLNQSGKRINYKKGLTNTSKHSQTTFVTDPWLITDSNDNCLGIYTFNESTDVSITGDIIKDSISSGSTNSPSSNSTTVTVGNSDLLPLSDNLARLSGVVVNVSSEYNETWKKDRLIDGQLLTSWFTAAKDAANLGTKPYIELIFPQPVNIKGVNLKGNREYSDGYDIFEGVLTVKSQSSSSSYNVVFPAPDRDFNIAFAQNINSVTSVRFDITKDESVDPGLSEFEVVAAK